MRSGQLALLSVPIALGVAHAAPILSSFWPGHYLFPVVKRVKSAKSVALTFDDGPGPDLEQFLDLLAQYDARATFFLVGEQVVLRPDAPGLIAAAGHEVAVHGFTHRNHLKRTPGDLSDDIRRARTLIEDASGHKSTLFRPPYGIFSYGSWRETGHQELTRVLWSRWGKDWEETATPQGIADLVGYPRPGDVILLHDADRYGSKGSWRNTLGSLPIILERIAAAGLTAKPVSELLAESAQTEP